MYQYSQMRSPLRKLVSSATQLACVLATGAALSVDAGALGFACCPSGTGDAAWGGRPSVAAGGRSLVAQTVGARKRSMLITERIGSPASWNSSVVSTIQMRAELKKILGTGKKDRNTASLQGAE